ncbi:Uncharacterised protein [Kluyvera cryocrescens]|uniref:Uncharacterized protein n=1 Tax=Kluyvera cryocrescens TaxID=580 RepID=A0A485CPJ3_KLUCR|nr:Uncharacterised protein [Kluyvera cryocrescens]
MKDKVWPLGMEQVISSVVVPQGERRAKHRFRRREGKGAQHPFANSPILLFQILQNISTAEH